MKRLIALIAIVSVFVVSCERKSGPQEISILQGTIEEISVPAPDYRNPLQTTVNVMVYTPPNYNANGETRYPVLYLLHGFGGNDSTFQQFFDIASIADYLISTNLIPPMIIVMPDASNDFGGTFYANSEMIPGVPQTTVFGTYEDFFINDLIPYIDDNYLTIADQGHRMLTGLSMGAYGAIRLASKHPDLFNSVASHSGPLDFSTFLTMTPSLIQILQAENPNGFNPATVAADPEGHPFSTFALAMAAMFSPKVGSIIIDTLTGDTLRFEFDFMKNEFPLVQLNDTLWAGVRMPFDATWNILPEVWDSLWIKYNDPVSLVHQNGSNISDNGVWYYFDCGDKDELFLSNTIQPFKDALDAEGISYDSQSGIYSYDGGYNPDELRAGHVTYFYLRLKRSFLFHAQHLGQ